MLNLKPLITVMSVKNKELLRKRREHVAKEILKRSHEKAEAVVNELAEKLFLNPRTIWRDLKEYRESC